MMLRSKITTAALLSVMSVSACLLTASKMLSDSWFERYQSIIMHNNNTLVNQIIASQQDEMEAELSSISRDRKVRKMVANGDIEQLKEEALPTFIRLSASGIIHKQQLFDTAGNVLFSQPESGQRQSKKALVSMVLKEGKVLRGIGREDGKLMIELAFPLFQRGKVIGAGIFMKEMDQAVEKIKATNKSEVSILNTEGHIELSSNAEFVSKLNLSTLKPSYQEVPIDSNFYGVTATPLFSPMQKTLGYVVDVKDQTQSITDMSQIKAISYISSAVILVVVGLFFAGYMYYSFKPVKAAVLAMEKSMKCITEGNLAEGNMSIKIDNIKNDEIGSILIGMNGMVTHLIELISQLVTMTQQLERYSNTLDQTAQASSTGIQVQIKEADGLASAITQLSASAEEISRSATLTSDEANQANDNSKESKAIINQAVDAIKTLNDKIKYSSDTIQNLKQETTKIGSVLDVIREIADQTNLLALNAAIEAARAGDQGRGFAVVSDEVRTLASRTQQSTTDINEMIERLQNGVKDAVTYMEETLTHVQYSVDTIAQSDKALETATHSISSITEMNTTIANSAKEQCIVTSEINKNIIEITKVTKDNVNEINKIKQTSDELNQIANSFSQFSSRFNI